MNEGAALMMTASAIVLLQVTLIRPQWLTSSTAADLEINTFALQPRTLPLLSQEAPSQDHCGWNRMLIHSSQASQLGRDLELRVPIRRA